MEGGSGREVGGANDRIWARCRQNSRRRRVAGLTVENKKIKMGWDEGEGGRAGTYLIFRYRIWLSAYVKFNSSPLKSLGCKTQWNTNIKWECNPLFPGNFEVEKTSTTHHQLVHKKAPDLAQIIPSPKILRTKVGGGEYYQCFIYLSCCYELLFTS